VRCNSAPAARFSGVGLAGCRFSRDAMLHRRIPTLAPCACAGSSGNRQVFVAHLPVAGSCRSGLQALNPSSTEYQCAQTIVRAFLAASGQFHRSPADTAVMRHLPAYCTLGSSKCVCQCAIHRASYNRQPASFRWRPADYLGQMAAGQWPRAWHACVYRMWATSCQLPAASCAGLYQVTGNVSSSILKVRNNSPKSALPMIPIVATTFSGSTGYGFVGL